MNSVLNTVREPENDSSSTVPLVDVKYSLTKDRTELEKLRESIPPDVRKKNDEKALIVEWMGELKYTPEIVREKFNTLVRKKRDLFNKDMTKSREEYSKTEKRTREDFLKNLDTERKDFLKKRVERDKRSEFFNDQDERRRTYFSDQKEKRDDFESDSNEKRKNFDAYLKEKIDDFNFELKDYVSRWKEKELQEKTLQKRSEKNEKLEN